MDNIPPKKSGSPRVIKVLLLSLLVLIIAAGIAKWLIATAPSPGRRPPREQAALVEAMPLKSGTESVVIEASGTVVPSREVELQARVTGQIIALSSAFRPGGRLSAGEEVARIDPEDYRLTVESRKADVVEAEQEYQIELGRQDIARHEWSLLSDRMEVTELDRELALRRPQLEQAKAAVASARAGLRQAELDLNRTSVTAPFNAVVLSKDIEVGTQVSSSTGLGTMAGTDEFWITLTLPVADLSWFSAGPGEEGARVDLFTTGPHREIPHWEGRVIEKLADLDDKGRLAQVIVSVSGPLDNPEHPLLLGMYVTAEIEGKAIPDVFSIPRNALRGSDRVWLVDHENRLELREVEPIWSGPDRVSVRDGLKPGRLLVTSNLGAPVKGMLLEVIETGNGEPGPESSIWGRTCATLVISTG